MAHPLSRRSYAEIISQTRELEKLDRRSLTREQLRTRLKRLFNGYSCFTRIVDAKLAWRARRLDILEPYDHVKELWYPPAHKLTTYGRLNKPGQPVMYISASHHTALLEMRPEVGERFVVLQLRLRNEAEKPHVMELGVSEKASQHGLPTSVHLLDQTAVGRRFLKSNSRKNFAIRSFLAREMTRVVPFGQEELFRFTFEISDILMESHRIDGVEYPSMAGDASAYGGGVNLALKPASVDKLFMADICWIAHVEGRSNAGFHIRCEKRARSISEAGSIDW